jgi:hypothetical protein
MYELKKIAKLLRSKFVSTGPTSYKKRICRAAVSQMLRNTAIEQSISLEADRFPASQEISRNLWKLKKFITAFTRARHLPLL